MTPKRRIYVVSEFYYPSESATAQLIHDLVSRLSSIHDVVVITSTQQKKPSRNIVDLSLVRAHSSNILVKAFKGLSFFAKSYLWLSIHLQPHDLILVVSNPPFIGLLALILNKTIKCNYIYLFQDLFPHSARLCGVIPARGFLNWTLNYITRLVCECSSNVIILNEDMHETATRTISKSVSWVTIHNWSVLTNQTNALSVSSNLGPVANLTSSKKFIVQYSGNIGRLHDIITIVEAARLLKRINPGVLFEVIGLGAKTNILKKYIHEFNLTNVHLKPPVPRDYLTQSISSSDICLVSHIPGAEKILASSKLYSILALGKPVLLISSKHSLLSTDLLNAKAGCVSEPGDPLELADIINRLETNRELVASMSLNSKKFYESNFGLDRSFEIYMKTINLI